MIGQNLPHHIEFVPMLTLNGCEGAARRFPDTHQVTALIDIHVMAIVKGILIQPPTIFTFPIDDKGEGGNVKG